MKRSLFPCCRCPADQLSLVRCLPSGHRGSVQAAATEVCPRPVCLSVWQSADPLKLGPWDDRVPRSSFHRISPVSKLKARFPIAAGRGIRVIPGSPRVTASACRLLRWGGRRGCAFQKPLSPRPSIRTLPGSRRRRAGTHPETAFFPGESHRLLPSSKHKRNWDRPRREGL